MAQADKLGAHEQALMNAPALGTIDYPTALSADMRTEPKIGPVRKNR